MAGTKDVTGHKIIKAGENVIFGGGAAYYMHQIPGGDTPTLDIYGSFSNEPRTGGGGGIATDQASTLVVLDIHAGGGFICYGRTAGVSGVSANCPMEFINDGSIRIYSGGRNGAYGVFGSSVGFDLHNTGSIDVQSENGYAQGMELAGAGAHVDNSGGIGASGRDAVGFISTGAGLVFVNSGGVGASGMTAIGMELSGADATVTNLGQLSTQADGCQGVVVSASGVSIDNQGSLYARPSTVGASTVGVRIAGGDDFHLSNSGTLSATVAISEDLGVSSDVTLVNSGRITGAIQLGAGDDHVDNTGAITRPVHLGDGADVFTMSGHGHVNGGVFGGAGDDVLTGAKAADQLLGASGADHLTGAAGADVLSGGEGADVFVYGALSDSDATHTDLIIDLDGSDAIDLSAIDADATVDGDQAFVLVAALDGHAGQLALSYDAGTDTTSILGDVDGNGVADLVIHAAGDQSAFAGFVL